MIATYELGDQTYVLSYCKSYEIPSHVEKVFPYWGSEVLDHQIKRMENAVKSKTAYKLDNNLGENQLFIYIEKQKRIGYLIALWFTRKRYLAMFYNYLFFHLSYERFRFLPHYDNLGRIPFLFAVSDQSIIRYQTYGEYLEVIVGSEKLQKLARTHYLRLNTKETSFGRRRRNIRSNRISSR